MDFSLFHEPNLSDPNPQTADIKSGYRGRESRTTHRDVEIFLDMSVIWTDYNNFVSPNNKICSRNINFFSPNEIQSVQSFGLTLLDITGIRKLNLHVYAICSMFYLKLTT